MKSSGEGDFAQRALALGIGLESYVVDDVLAVERAVRGFLTPFGGVDHADGVLLEWQQALKSVDFDFGRTHSYRATVEKLEVVSLEGDMGRVELDAEVQSKITDTRGERLTITERFTGPVELMLIGRNWKVVDIAKNGLSLRDRTFRCSLRGAVGDLSVRAWIGKREDSLLRLAVEVTNAGRDSVQILGQDLAVRTHPWRWKWSPDVVVPVDRIPVGTSRFRMDALMRFVPGDPQIRFVLRTSRGAVDVKRG